MGLCGTACWPFQLQSEHEPVAAGPS